MSENDVPSPIDFHALAQAKEWEAQTVRNRPWRPQFFAAFVDALNNHYRRAFSVLELGSGPGHLAEQVIAGCDTSRYAALDISAAMHELARARLGTNANKVEFLEQDFRLSTWNNGLVGKFDAVITMQAAHEVRHKRHLAVLFVQARACLVPEGLFLFCDHYAEAGSGKNPDLFLTADAQPAALRDAGFRQVEKILDLGGMALFAAINPP